ncbi:hypothetical protein [Thalassospira australica]|uniref:hypothetical protein n=1 Tax=Thalassospira australica TaxID=1528106 RepID=UPI00192E4742|nr:hypothetical protein [Thalassospira australica]
MVTRLKAHGISVTGVTKACCGAPQLAKVLLRAGIILMVELGDLREGLMPCDVGKTIHILSGLPNITFMGLGANLACRNGISPDNDKMGKLSALANRIDGTADTAIHPMSIVSGGNSSNLDWVFSGGNTRRINNLRLGEAVLLGCDPLHRKPIHGLHVDAVRLTAEVIESKTKPSKPWGTIAQTTFGTPPIAQDVGDVFQAILAIGQQDVDPSGLCPPDGIKVLGGSSDHLLLNTGTNQAQVGSEITFLPDYSALLRSMTSPYVEKTYIGEVETSCLIPQAVPDFAS